MDLCFYGKNYSVAGPDVARVAGLATEQGDAAYRGIVSKRKATRYHHLRPPPVEPIDEIAY